MPTTRRQSLPAASSSGSVTSTPIRKSHLDSVSAEPTSARSARTSSRTPQPHHRTAEEQTLAEAQKILSTPLDKRLRASGSAAAESPRDRRHRHLEQARHEAEAAASEDGRSEAGSVVVEKPDGTRNSSYSKNGESGELDQDESRTDSMVPDTASHEDEGSVNQSVTDISVGQTVSPSIPSATSTLRELDATPTRRKSDDLLEPPIEVNDSERRAQDFQSDNGDDDDGASSSETSSTSSASSESESESDADSESDDTTSDSEDSDEEEERLEKLLQAAKISALRKQEQQKSNATATFSGDADDEVVLQFDATEEKRRAAPLPDITIPVLPKAHISFAQDGSAKASTSYSALPGPYRPRMASRKGKDRVSELELDNRPYERELSKREKAAQPRKATASELWTTLPSARRDDLQQMKRDYQALSLANSLDPKRFMKGGNKAAKVPETFAIGTMVDQPRYLQDSTLSRDRAYRPGEIVKDVVGDEHLGSTAKRKYGDLQWKRMENGRGKGWKKRSKW